MNPRQRWLAGSITAGLMLMLFLVDRWITSATPTFPKPRRVREQWMEHSWFLGTGPWSGWECLLLWVDALVLVFFVSAWLTRKMTV